MVAGHLESISKIINKNKKNKNSNKMSIAVWDQFLIQKSTHLLTHTVLAER